MLKFLRRIILDFKEYFLVVLLSIISISLLASNEKPAIKRLRTFAFGSFAVFNELINYPISIFKKDYSIEELKEENARLMLEVNRLRNRGLENDKLRSMLLFKDTSNYPLIGADVISKLVNKVQGNFIINRGAKNGITAGMPAINDKGLIGVVVDVTDDFSVVQTLYNSSLNIAVTIQRINVDGILSWDGKELVIKNIPTTYDIHIGDSVETSNFSTVFPPNIPVGIISKRESVPIGLLHSISVKPFVDIYSVNNLFILKIVPSKQINQLEMNLLIK